jgi:hypothetical protein
MYYEVYGEGPPLLLLHGGLERLTRRSHRSRAGTRHPHELLALREEDSG